MNVARAVWMLGTLVVAGCSTQSQPADPSPQASSSSTVSSPTAAPTPAPTTASQFDARWIGIDSTQPWNWEESDRGITSDFQRFGFRPVDESELPRRCNGCGVNPPTALLTVYAPGKFDPTEARAGEPASVNADNDGFFRANQGSDDAVLAWQYEQDGWATVRGRTTKTSELDRMLELARAIRPAERPAIRVPMSLASMPAQLPLAEINIDHGDYGTTLRFAPCGRPDVGGTGDCYDEADTMRVQIWPKEGYYPYIDEKRFVPVKIGGKDGLYDERSHKAGVQIQRACSSCSRSALHQSPDAAESQSEGHSRGRRVGAGAWKRSDLAPRRRLGDTALMEETCPVSPNSLWAQRRLPAARCSAWPREI